MPLVEYLLGIDIGTYESKGVLVDRQGQTLVEASIPHDLSIPRPGWAEAEADGTWWHDFVLLARDLPTRGGISTNDIVSVACSAIGPCVLPVDRSGRPLRAAILYGIDTRATCEVEELTRALGETWIAENTGSALSSQAAGPKILWLRRNQPDLWAQTARLMTSTSYLVYRLTGRVVIDHYTAAAYGPLYNLHSRDWDPEALRLICDVSLLPELDWSTAIAGKVTRQAARETGLAEGTPVTVGTADAAGEAVAGGVLDPGDVMLMYGSTLFFIQICSTLPASRQLWPTVYLEPDTYALAAGMSTTGALTRWFRDNFAAAETMAERQGDTNAYQLLANQAAEVAPGAEGLLMLPYFSGERTPISDPLARGVVAGLSLSHTRAHLYRALLEGVGFGVRSNLEAMTAAGQPPRRLVAIGGGVRNPLWLQIVSDVTGREQIVQHTPGASFGDAILAAVGIGLLRDVSDARRWIPQGSVVRPNAELASLYGERYVLFRELYSSTAGLVHALAAQS